MHFCRSVKVNFFLGICKPTPLTHAYTKPTSLPPVSLHKSWDLQSEHAGRGQFLSVTSLLYNNCCGRSLNLVCCTMALHFFKAGAKKRHEGGIWNMILYATYSLGDDKRDLGELKHK